MQIRHQQQTASPLGGDQQVRTFHYVPHHRVLDFARLGWLPHWELLDTRHGEYAITMEWLCDCPLATPTKRRQVD